LKKFSLKPDMTICIPVYNGEKTIQRTIESILSQTYENFSLIISDNASTDKTQNICEQYKKKDSRIIYYKQESTIPLWDNFDFILRNVETEFFMWISADDFILPTFIEKTIKIVKSNKNIVGCCSRSENFILKNNNIQIISKQKKSILSKFGSFLNKKNFAPISGNYNQRMRKCLSASTMFLYSVFRTDIAKKSFVISSSIPEIAFFIKVCKFGELHFVDDSLFRYYLGGTTSEGPIKTLRDNNANFYLYLFPMMDFTIFFIKTFGFLQFFKNFDIIFRRNLFHTLHNLYNIFKSKK